VRFLFAVMAISEGMINFTDAFVDLPPQIVESFSGLATILKAVGIAFIVYVCYAVVMAFLNWRRHRRVVRIEKKVDVIDKKLDTLLKSSKKSRKKKK